MGTEAVEVARAVTPISEAVSRPAPAGVEQEREMLTDLDKAEADEKATAADWRNLQHRIARLAAGVLVGDDGVERSRVDPVEFAVAKAELEERVPEVARRLHVARQRRQAAQRDLANERLPALLEAHTEVGENALRARAQLEAAWVALAVASWRCLAAYTVENQAAQAVVKTAKGALRDEDDAGRAVLASVDRRLPARVGADGMVAEWQERPSRGLWDGPLDVGNPGSARQLAEVAAAGHQRGLGGLGRSLQPIFAKAWQKLNNTR